MLLLLVASASAATLDVCATCAYRTPEEAVAAARSRDVIHFAAGVHDTTGIDITRDVTLTGDGSDVTFLRSSTAETIIHAGLTPDYGTILDVRISGITLEPPSENGVSFVNTNASLVDVRAEGFSGTAVTYAIQTGDRFRLLVSQCGFTNNTTGIAVRNLWSFPADLGIEVSNSSFSGHTGTAVLAGGTSVEVTRSRFEANVGASGGAITTWADEWLVLDGNVFSGNSGGLGGAVHASWGAGLSMQRNLFCANEAESGGAVYGDVGSVTANGNVFAGNVARSAGGDLSLPLFGVASIQNNTFVGGYAPTGGSLWAANHTLTFRNNVVAYTSEYGLYGEGGSATIAYNDFWEVAPDAVGGAWPAPDATNLAVDPMFVSYVEGGCEDLDLGLGEGSPLYDAGDPSTTDSDGTIADIGATGGTTSADGTKRWYLDADGDGHGVLDDVAYGPTAPVGYAPNPDDCDDGNADLYPGNQESCDGEDEDCDGIVDDDCEGFESDGPDGERGGRGSGGGGCGGAAPAPWAGIFLVAFAALRTRRSGRSRRGDRR
jgi:hypothetical protein